MHRSEFRILRGGLIMGLESFKQKIAEHEKKDKPAKTKTLEERVQALEKMHGIKKQH